MYCELLQLSINVEAQKPSKCLQEIGYAVTRGAMDKVSFAQVADFG